MIRQMGEEGGQRSDARANRAAVIDAAIELLAARPEAGIQEIADASGVGRSTVYRHFPDRVALFEGLMAEVGDQSAQTAEGIISRGGPATGTLRDLGVAFVELGLHFRFLYSHRRLSKPSVRARTHDEESPTWGFLRAAQERGEIRDDQPVSWLSITVLTLSMAMVQDVLAGRIGQEQAGSMLGETLVSAFTAS